MKSEKERCFPSPNDRSSTKKNVMMNPTGAVLATKLHPCSEYELK